MGCCGEKRAALRARAATAPATAEAARTPPRTAEPEPEDPAGVALEYRGDEPVVVRGPATGRLYTFSAGRLVRTLAAADADALQASRLFALRRPERTRAAAAESDGSDAAA